MVYNASILQKFEGRIGCFRIVTSNTLSILSETEMITTGKVVVPDNEEMETGNFLFVFEFEIRRMVGRTLVNNSSNTVWYMIFFPNLNLMRAFPKILRGVPVADKM